MNKARNESNNTYSLNDALNRKQNNKYPPNQNHPIIPPYLLSNKISDILLENISPTYSQIQFSQYTTKLKNPRSLR
jgi:hypothetical protein